MSHALWKSSPAICTNGSLQMFFQEVISPGGNKGTTFLRNRKYLKTLGHLSMKTWEAELLSSDAGTVPGTKASQTSNAEDRLSPEELGAIPIVED